MNWLNSLKIRRDKMQPHRPAHMTWAKKSLGRSMSRTKLFFQKQIWIRPIIAVVLLSIVGYGMNSAIERTMTANLRSGLTTLRNVETEMMLTWFKSQESIATAQANNREVRQLIYRLLEVEETDGKAADVDDIRRQIDKHLAPALSAHDYLRYMVVDKTRRIIAATETSLLGQKEIPQFDHFLNRAFEGESTVSPPFISVTPVKNKKGELRAGQPTMYVCAPIRDDSFQVVGALALQIQPDREFTHILQLGRVGDTGETYAFDRNGMMVSNSRFDEELMILGLIPDTPESTSLLSLQVRDPGGNMMEGYRPRQRRSELPLTKMAQDAIAGNTGEDLTGYNDYRGVPVVGAWTWIPKYEIGVCTEVNVDQAFRPLVILQRTFFSLFILLGLLSVAIFIFTLVVARLKREAQKATIEAQQLGQYTLEVKIGAGAMGVVYKAFHSMLRRPTAVKMLDVDLVNDESIARFEREVQITCKLNNPNTVAIYDYGRTPDGVFYYAMEYLDGIDLQTLIERYGPLPEARVIHLLTQICGSLFEAHSLGLVHRDIKPANIMLNRRGGISDVVKVLDFGLVKAVDDVKQAKLTSANSLTGTPLYMSPEAIQAPDSVDPRSDIYAVGAVGYFLLTGRPVFEASNIVELCNQHLTAIPVAPSKITQQPVSPELESALMVCLEKSISKRPQTARDLATLLKRSPAAMAWSLEESDAWWGRHEREQHAVTPPLLTKPGMMPSKGTTDGPLDRTIISN